MARTSFSTSDEQAVSLFARIAHKEAGKDTLFSGSTTFDPGGANAVSVKGAVHEKTDLTVNNGKSIQYNLRAHSTEGLEGVITNHKATLEGNAEKIVLYGDTVTPTVHRFGVDLGDRYSNSITKDSLTLEGQDQIKEKMAAVMETRAVNALTSSPTTIKYAGTATSVATLTTSTTLTLDDINNMAISARTGDGGNTFKISRAQVGSEQVYILLVTPEMFGDVTRTDEFKQLGYYVHKEDKSNPLLRGDDFFIYRGVLVRSYDRLTTLTNGGAGADVRYAKAVLLGKQGLLKANGARVPLNIEWKDGKWRSWAAWGWIGAYKKSVFDGKDFGSMGFYCSATAL